MHIDLIEDFKSIAYLASGNKRQKLAFKTIKAHKVFEKLKGYNPILTGTIPIEIDLPESDLDIICQCEDHSQFYDHLIQSFSQETEFKIYSSIQNGVECTIAEFKTDSFLIEVFGQQIPTDKQNAYRHMLIEYQILKSKGHEFKARIIQLKSKGLKTEPAFAKLLNLKGNPYIALLQLEFE